MKPVDPKGKPKHDRPPHGKPAAAARTALKAKLRGHGLSQSDVDAIVTTTATYEEIAQAVIARLRVAPKGT